MWQGRTNVDSTTWNVQHGKEQMKRLEDAMPEVIAARDRLVGALEAKLGM
jgi:hypothetical protein